MLLTTRDLTSMGYTPDEDAQNAIWAHCASPAFLAVVVEMTEMIDTDYQPEICVTKETEAGLFNAMGFSGLGLFLKGDVTAMFTKDIGSSYEACKREFYEEDLSFLVDKYKDLKCSDERWTETFIVPRKVIGIWMTREMANKMDEKHVARLKKRVGNFPITIL